MPLNPFDETLDQIEEQGPRLTPESPDPYDETVRLSAQSSELKLRTAIKTALPMTPARAAEAQRLAARTGLPPAVIERNFDRIQSEAKLRDTPYARMLTETPALAEWASDPTNAAIAKDDLEQLGSIEWLLTAPQRAMSQGINQVRYAQLRAASLFRPLTQEEHDQANAYKFAMTEGGALGTGDSWFRGAITGTMQQLPNLFGAALMGAKRAVPMAIGGGAAAAIMGAGPGSPVTVPVGTIAGFGAGMMAGGAEFGFQLEAGLALDEYEQIADPITKQKLDPDVARAAAIATGVINSGLEAAGLGIFLKAIPGANKLTGLVTRNAVKQALKAPTVRAALADMMKSYAGGLAGETAVEVAQRAVTIMSGELAKAVDGTEIDYRGGKDIVRDLANEGAGALQSFALLMLPGPTAGAAINVRKARQAAQNVDFFKALAEGVATSQTFQKAPEAARAFVDAATKDGPLSHVYAPVGTWATYWQEKQLDPADVAVAMGIPRADYETAVNTGEDLAIPTGVYAAQLAGTEHNQFFVDELRLGPDEMNGREARAFVEEQQRAAEAAAAAQAPAPTGVEQVRAAVSEQLVAAGVEESTAGDYAALYESAFASLAERAGVDPEQLYAKYGLKVKREGIPASAVGTEALPTGGAPAESSGEPAAGAREVGTAQTPVSGPETPGADTGAVPQQEEIPGFKELEASIQSGVSVQLVEPGAGTVENASGESAASMEAQSRQAGMQQRGEAFVVYDRAGNRRPLIGPEAVDYIAQPGELYGVESPEGFRTLENRGGRRRDIFEGAAERVAERKATAQRLAASGEAVQLEHPSGRSALVGPDMSKPGRFRSTRFDEAGEPAGHVEAATLEAAITETLAEGYTEVPDATAEPETRRAARQERSATERRVAASDPGSGKRADDKAGKFRERVFDAVVDNARALDPAVDDALLRREFDFRYQFLVDQQALAAEHGGNPRDLLKLIAKLGGIHEGEGGYTGEIARLAEGREKFGALAGVPGVFAPTKKVSRTQNQRTRGLGLDDLLRSLEGYPEYAYIENLDMLVDAIEAAANVPRDASIDSRLPGTEELREVMIRAETDWWADPWVPLDLTEDVSESDVADLAAGDTSFDITEFEQGLFDELAAQAETLPIKKGATVTIDGQPFEVLSHTKTAIKLVPLDQAQRERARGVDVGMHGYTSYTPGKIRQLHRAGKLAVTPPPAVDVLDTGEAQPRLPEAGDVREQEVATPEIADLPFALTAPAGPKEKKGQKATTSDAYARALEAAGVATRDFTEAQRAYRAREIGDAEYLAARLAHDEAQQAFDVAFQREQDRQRGQRTMFQSGATAEPVTQETLDAFAQSLRDKIGPDLTVLDLRLKSPGSMSIESMAAAREAQHAGIGTAAMVEIVRFADRNRLRIELSLGRKGYQPTDESKKTSSSERLRRFYRRFGFVDNRGRHKDYALSVYTSMYREPSRSFNQSIEAPRTTRRASLEELQEQGFDTSQTFFHQTAAAVRPAIEAEGFDLAKGRARLSDEGVPDGVFFKPDQADIGVGAADKADQTQIPVFIRFGKTERYKNRAALEYELTGDDRYRELVGDARRYDSEQAREFDRLWKEMGARERADTSRGLGEKHTADLDAFIEQWKAGNVERATVARARATEILRARDVETVVIDEDAGSMGRKTKTIITLAGNQVALATPGEERILFQPERVARQDARGAIRFGPGGQVDIALFERADLSTFLHESGHFFLGVFGDLVARVEVTPADARTPQQQRLVDDYAKLLEWFGVSDRSQIDVAQHEQFARGFEQYLGSGQAPTVELRSSFARFRAWLLGIYRSLKNLNVELTPEVMRVMDRLIATDAAIEDAQLAGHVAPIFTTPESAGMDAAEFTLYRAAVEEASRTAREQLDAKLVAEVQREQTAQWKAQRATIREAVAGEVHQRPVYRALAAMRTGTNPDGTPITEGLVTEPMKLSRAIIVGRYGEDRLKRLPRPYVYTTEGGLDPDVVAELFGFSSGDELLTRVAAAESQRDAIEKETDARMLAEHGSMLLDGTLTEAAQAAVQNETRDAIIRAEIRALNRLRRTVKPFQQAERADADARVAGEKAKTAAVAGELKAERARVRRGPETIRAGVPPVTAVLDAARARVAATRIRDLRPGVFWTAARRANTEALTLAAKADYEGAIAAKTQELLAVAIFREMQRTREDVDARLQAVKQFHSTATRAILGQAGDSYLDQVDGILDRYEFLAVPQRTLDRRARIRDWVAGLEANGLPVELPEEVLDDSRRLNYQDTSVEEFVGVTDGLAQILHIARLKDRLLTEQQDRDYAAVRDALVASIYAHTPTKAAPIEFRDEDRRRGVADFFAAHAKIARLARAIDGFVDNGRFWNAIIRPINAAADAEVNRKQLEGKRYSAIIETHYPGSDITALADVVFIPEIGGSLSREGRIAVALNWGNATNRQRLLADPRRKWGEIQVQGILNTLDARDWAFVQDTWDFIDTFWPEIEAKQQRVTGLKPEKVEALPVETAHGTFRGGYYPIAYDPRLTVRAAQHEAASEASLKTSAAYVRSTTRRGHTKARADRVSLSLKLDLGVIFNHVEQVVHDLTHHEMLIDVTRLMRDSGVSSAILETAGDIVYQKFSRALQDIAVGTAPARNALERAAVFMRTGTQIAQMGWNLWTGIQQPLGLFNGMSRVGPTWVARGLKRWLRDAATLQNTTQWIAEVSPFMRARTTTATQDIADLRATLTKPGGWFDGIVRKATADVVTQQTILDSFLWHIGLMQRVADVPTWLGAYEKHMAGGVDEQTAIALADQAVLDSQGGGQIKDLSEVERGGPIARLFMTFYSYGNTLFNATADRAGATNFKSPASVATFLGHLSLLYVMPALATATLARAVGRDNDDDPFLIDVGREILASAMNTVVLVRELSGLLRDGVRGYAGPAGARAFESIYRVGAQIKQGEIDEGLAKALNEAAGVVFRYPSAQVQRTVDGWVALDEGKTSNPLALLFGGPK